MSFKKTITVEIDGVEYEEEWELEFHFTKGEKAVMYDRNGEGHPGSPPEAELISATLVKRVRDNGEESTHLAPRRLGGLSWFERANEHGCLTMDELEKWAFEKVEAASEAAYDDACDHELHAAREEGRRPRHIRRRR